MGIVILKLLLTKFLINFILCFILAEMNKFKIKALKTPLTVNDIETSDSSDWDLLDDKNMDFDFYFTQWYHKNKHMYYLCLIILMFELWPDSKQ